MEESGIKINSNNKSYGNIRRTTGLKYETKGINIRRVHDFEFLGMSLEETRKQDVELNNQSQ